MEELILRSVINEGAMGFGQEDKLCVLSYGWIKKAAEEKRKNPNMNMEQFLLDMKSRETDKVLGSVLFSLVTNYYGMESSKRKAREEEEESSPQQKKSCSHPEQIQAAQEIQQLKETIARMRGENDALMTEIGLLKTFSVPEPLATGFPVSSTTTIKESDILNHPMVMEMQQTMAALREKDKRVTDLKANVDRDREKLGGVMSGLMMVIEVVTLDIMEGKRTPESAEPLVTVPQAPGVVNMETTAAKMRAFADFVRKQRKSVFQARTICANREKTAQDRQSELTAEILKHNASVQKLDARLAEVKVREAELNTKYKVLEAQDRTLTAKEKDFIAREANIIRKEAELRTKV